MQKCHQDSNRASFLLHICSQTSTAKREAVVDLLNRLQRKAAQNVAEILKSLKPKKCFRHDFITFLPVH